MKSFPWDSVAVSIGEDGYPVYDRAYMASDLREVYQTFFSNGIFTDSATALKVSPGENMTVRVEPGRCCINGTVGYENDERELAIQASGSSDRIDTVVLRWDTNVDVREIDLYVLTGAPSDTPVRPTLTRSETVWELGLADIYVTAHSLSVKAEKVTDTRLDTNRCGVVAPFVRLDTKNFYDQLMAQTNIAVELAQSLIDGTALGGKVSKSGDTMTGPLVNGDPGTYTKIESGAIVLAKDDTGDGIPDVSLSVGAVPPSADSIGIRGELSLRNPNDGSYLNVFRMLADKTTFSKPLTLESGGTGAVTSAGARVNIGAMAAISKNGYYGLAQPDGNETNYVRTPVNGIIPYQQGGSGVLGTPSWYFSNVNTNQLNLRGSNQCITLGDDVYKMQGVFSFTSSKEVVSNNVASGASVDQTITFNVANKDKLMDYIVTMGEQWNCAAYIISTSLANGVVTVKLRMNNNRSFAATASCRVTIHERYHGLVAR